MPASKALQLNAVDTELRNGLWSALHDCYFEAFDRSEFIYNDDHRALLRSYWLSFFKQPIDTVPSIGSTAVKYLRDYFTRCKWYEVYDFVEFSLQHGPQYSRATIRDYVNAILERENSGYRIVVDEVVAITHPAETNAIDAAQATPFAAVNTHINKALELLADRKTPDYRNSIKESISAVESAAKLIAGEGKVTLKPALDALHLKHPLHPALRKAFETLYGYTSDAHGIRHALLGESELDFDDAKFMLVTCSAFVNYLIGKTTV